MFQSFFACSHFQVPSSSKFDLSNGLFSLQIQPQSGEPVTAVNGSSQPSSAIPAASPSGAPLRKGLMWQQGGHSALLSQVVRCSLIILIYRVNLAKITNNIRFWLELTTASDLPLARPDILPLEGALLCAHERLSAMLQEGFLAHLGDGRVHLQNSTRRGESHIDIIGTVISFARSCNVMRDRGCGCCV